MNNVFGFRDQLISEYRAFSRSFFRITAADIKNEVERQYADGRYWPEPLIQINPNYQCKGTVQQLVADGILHDACADLFQTGKAEGRPQTLKHWSRGKVSRVMLLQQAPWSLAPTFPRSMPCSL